MIYKDSFIREFRLKCTTSNIYTYNNYDNNNNNNNNNNNIKDDDDDDDDND